MAVDRWEEGGGGEKECNPSQCQGTGTFYPLLSTTRFFWDGGCRHLALKFIMQRSKCQNVIHFTSYLEMLLCWEAI